MRDETKRRVLVALPSYDGRMDVDTTFTITGFQRECILRGWGFGLYAASFVAPISVARSRLCQQFLATDATDLFFLDADVGCEPREMIKLIEHPVDFVLGVYPERHLDHSYTVLGLEDGKGGRLFHRDPSTGLVEIQGGPAGFMRVRRHVLEIMMAHYDPEHDYIGNDNAVIPMLFRSIIGRPISCSEDIWFGRRWRELGGKVWCDPDVDIRHSGRASFCSNFWKDFIIPNELVTA